MNNGKPVILHLRASEFFGSPEKLIAGQMKYLRNFHSICASFVRGGSPNEFLNKMNTLGFTTEALEGSRINFGIPGRLCRLIASLKADLLITHEYKSNFYGNFACRKAKIPQIAYFHGWTAEDIKVGFYNMIDKHFMRRADKVVTVSKATAGRLVDAGIPAPKIEVVYNAIELGSDEIHPPSEKNRIPIVGIIGRLSHEKGVHILLQALQDIKPLAPEFAVRIYGDGPDQQKLQAMAADMKLNDIVTFEGFRRDLDKCYPEFDMIVIPSISEGHPLVILEAWKYGVGVIASRAGGIPEIIDDGQNGMLVDVNDYRGLGKAIQFGLENRDLLREYGRRGHAIALQRFSFEKQSEQLERIYQETIDNYNAKRN
jgi:glycosyltransferase involved in cell wall biosynthesis